MDEKNESNAEERINKAFRYIDSEKSVSDEALFEDYVRGGIDVLYEKIIDKSNSLDEYLTNLYDFLEEFEERYGGSSMIRYDRLLSLYKKQLNMEIKDNVIKQCLKNVYFITGTPCGGKTTISRALSKKYGFAIYDVDQEFSKHKSLSNSIDQPAMNKEFANADEFFLRPHTEYGKWLVDNTREQLAFIVTDLIRMSKDQTVICDLHLSLDEAMQITDPAHIVFLIKNPKNIIDDYCNRPDHDDFHQFINSASNPSLAKANCDKTLELVNKEIYESIKKSSYFWVERDSNSTVEETLYMVETHFGFKPTT